MRYSLRLLIIAFGVLGILVGLIIGLSSKQVSYGSVKQNSIAHYLSSEQTGYLQMYKSSALYYVDEKDFTPKINGIHTFVDQDVISFKYDPNTSKTINVQSSIGTHLDGDAYRVVQITFFAFGGKQTTYTTPEYRQDHQGYASRYWAAGIPLIILGLLLIGASFLFIRNKTKPATPLEIQPIPLEGSSDIEKQVSMQALPDTQKQIYIPPTPDTEEQAYRKTLPDTQEHFYKERTTDSYPNKNAKDADIQLPFPSNPAFFEATPPNNHSRDQT